uniref:Uncharacterized protein n=1 Tax=Magallana gigas TaxID=29159 RepID=K1RXL0_MAGGI
MVYSFPRGTVFVETGGRGEDIVFEDGVWGLQCRYTLENILVICAIVGLCLLIIAIVTLISIFTSRWRYTMSCEHDLEDSRYDNTIISTYEGDSSMWTTEGTFRTLDEI